VTPSRLYTVTTTNGTMALYAPSPRDAILSGLELMGPDAKLVSCFLVGEWADR
jgi:hypothetical protein